MFLWGIRIRFSLMSKILNLTLLLDVTPYRKMESPPSPSCFTSSLLGLEITCWKKVSLIVFGQTLPKVFPVVYIFKFTISTYLKKLIGIKSFSTKQCPAELSPLIIPTVYPNLTKIVSPPFILLVWSTMYRLPCLFPQTYHLGQTL